ncbi:YybS family protein [Clostridium formicaceticum]|uniref:DUF2232 domain-containing protein n=1 Tax=Clostridium formicaceticum TaxID=1497 RepID=A0AAC9WIB2_9CLOT|nr:YybS family protein [Clostridium formicaceticum]AOY75354.1 hypothetical protein BJL90_05230 [Clostridium formicaceticum]ARE89806.1 hypothetical protein CLFO_42890 [Clostridium formicaceticum]
MKDYSNKKAFIEAALMVTITSFFVVATLYIPILSVLLFFLPVPFIILSFRYSTSYTVISLAVASLFIGLLTGVLYTVFIFVIITPIALIMGHYMKHHKKPFQVIGVGTAVSVFSIFLMIQIVSMVSGVHIIEEMGRMIGEVLDHQVEMLHTVNVSSLDIQEAINYFMMILPGLIIVQSMIGAFINYYLAVAIMNRLKFISYKFDGFEDFKLPANIVLGSFIIFILSLLTRYVPGIDHNSLIANATLIFVVVFFLQGISFINYLLKKRKFPKFLRIFILILFVFISPLMTLVAIIGLLDAMIDIRRIGKRND